MLTRDTKRLAIFDNFKTDYQLPKHTKKTRNDLYDSESVKSINFDSDRFSVPSQSNDLSIGVFSFDGNDNVGETTPKKSLLKRIIEYLTPKDKPKLSVHDFFKSVKSSAINIEQYSNRVNSYLTALNNAKHLNQEALVVQIQNKINEAKYEAILYASGFRTIILEEQVVKFYKECKKGLEMTWIRNFIRVIPEKAVEKKKIADSLEVFDNYVILHFDPDKKAFVEEQKDPILFGVISGSRKLYYIADWIDEYCDLTLEQFIDKFGDEAIKANDITVNFKL